MDLIERKRLRHIAVYQVEANRKLVVVQAISPYIPIDEFKEAFNFIEDLVKSEGILKLIFDKRNLTVFHQPSMEWYFVEWKERMYFAGLRIHRKILPVDEIFRESVRIGREKIYASYPNGKFHELDIAYSETLEHAINS